MKVVFDTFKDNVAEVEKYFELLKALENNIVHMNNSTNTITFTVDSDLSKILKANTFLLLYNLIESTIKSGLWEVFENIKTNNTSYNNLLSKLKILWIDNKVQLDYKTKDKTVNQKVLDIINDVLQNNTTYYKDKRNLKFQAGNLDIKGITKTFESHGITTISAHNNTSDAFRTTKTNRNELAHGDLSFISCGRNYSYRDLRVIKTHIIRYLIKCLFEIEAFITNKKYIVNNQLSQSA